MRHEIKINHAEKSKINEVDFNNLPFGKFFSDHMFIADYKDGAWQNFRIEPFHHLSLHPATSAFHYGQAIFEGLKAQKDKDGNALVFRPDANAKRFNISAERMGMPSLPDGLFTQAVEEIVRIDHQWIPSGELSSLYIRPFMMAVDEYVGIKESDTYTFIIFTSPVGAYYSAPVKVYISEDYIRAFPGGVGFAKCAGNYGASLLPLRLAKQKGYDQVLWLDGIEKKYLQECGTMNVFFVIDHILITPPLDEGTILDGVTRNSVIQIAKKQGVKVEERKISTAEFFAALAEGRVQEAFGAGTAATIAPIIGIGFEEKHFELPAVETREISAKIKQELFAIKSGEINDEFGWMMKIKIDEKISI